VVVAAEQFTLALLLLAALVGVAPEALTAHYLFLARLTLAVAAVAAVAQGVTLVQQVAPEWSLFLYQQQDTVV
jgi:hypothetical protein